jgi:prepilin-type N-terminal cleavage/methylation domain-containing protein
MTGAHPAVEGTRSERGIQMENGSSLRIQVRAGFTLIELLTGVAIIARRAAHWGAGILRAFPGGRNARPPENNNPSGL